MGIVCTVACNCPTRPVFGLGSEPWACAHEDGFLVWSKPSSLFALGDALVRAFGDDPRLFPLAKRIGEYANQPWVADLDVTSAEAMELQRELLAIGEAERWTEDWDPGHLKYFEDVLGPISATEYPTFGERIRRGVETLRRGRHYFVPDGIEQGLELCRHAIESGNPMQFRY